MGHNDRGRREKTDLDARVEILHVRKLPDRFPRVIKVLAIDRLRRFAVMRAWINVHREGESEINSLVSFRELRR